MSQPSYWRRQGHSNTRELTTRKPAGGKRWGREEEGASSYGHLGEFVNEEQATRGNVKGHQSNTNAEIGLKKRKMKQSKEVRYGAGLRFIEERTHKIMSRRGKKQGTLTTEVLRKHVGCTDVIGHPNGQICRNAIECAGRITRWKFTAAKRDSLINTPSDR